MHNALQRLIGGSLQRQLTLGVVLIVTVLMTYFVWDINRYQRRLALEQDSSNVLALSHSLASASASGLTAKDVKSLTDLLNRQSRYHNSVYAMVLDLDGRVVAHTDPSRVGQLVTDLPTEPKPALLRQTATLQEAISPVMLGERAIGWAGVGTSGQVLQSRLLQINQSSLLHLLLVLVVSVAVAASGSRYVARRLHAITRVARDIEAGDTHRRVNVEGSDETAQLARQFNRMLDALAQRDAALKASETFKQRILNSVAAEVAVLDTQGVIVAVNDQWRQFARNDNNEAEESVQSTGIGSNYLQVCRAASAAGDVNARDALDGITAVLEGRLPAFSMDYPCHSPQRQHWFTLVVSPLGSDSGHGVVITHTDISKTKLAQQYERFRSQILELLASDADIPDLLLAMVNGVEQLHPGMLCSVLLLSDDGKRIGQGVAPSLPAFYNEALIGVEIGVGQGSCGTAAATGERVIVADIATHPYWAQFKDLALRAGVAACWSQPIFSAAGSVLGTFAIYHRSVHTPTDADIGLIQQTARLAGIALDHKQTQSALRTSENVFRTLFETSPVGVIYQDPDGHITSANPAAQRILGLTLSQLQGRTSMDPRWRAIHEDGSEFPGDQHPVSLALRTGLSQRDVVMGVVVPNRERVWIMVSATPLLEDGKVVQAYATFEDITERHQLETQIRQMAFYDSLTQLPNRRLLAERLRYALTASKRSGAMGAMMFLDLDNFKPLNDTHGHAMGDQLLIEVARRIKTCLREEDTVARVGGDEFVVMLTDLQSDPALASQHANNVAEKIGSCLAEPYVLKDEQTDAGQPAVSHRCTASIGVTLFSATDTDQEKIMHRADTAMYLAKDQGRNRVVFGSLTS